MTIQNKLYEKLRSENDKYLDSLLKSPPSEVIEAAEEIVTKENIVKFFKDNNQVSDSQAQWLYNFYDIDELHHDWKGVYGRLEIEEMYSVMKLAQGKGYEYHTYKAEIYLPGVEYPHLEVFSADNDVDAINQAHELAGEMKGAYLLEVHELDENYDSIREIDFQAHDPSLRRFMNVDLFDFLGRISDKVLIHYRNDWNIDKEFLLKRAESPDPEDKRIAWHVCATSTHQLNERDVLIKDSGAFAYWTDYHQNDPDMLGFYVEITGHENGRVYGNVFEVGDYAKHADYVWDIALPIDTVTLEYAETRGVNCGLTITVPRKEYDDDRQRLMCDSGDVVSIRMNPLEGNITLADIMKTEQAHRMGMPIGNMQEYLQSLDAKLFEIRGEPLQHLIKLVPSHSGETVSAKPAEPAELPVQTKPVKSAKPNKPQSFEKLIKESQAKADAFNRQKALNKEQQPVADKIRPEIGE